MQRREQTYYSESAISILCLFPFCGCLIKTDTFDVVKSIGMIRLVVGDVKFAHWGCGGRRPRTMTNCGWFWGPNTSLPRHPLSQARERERMDSQEELSLLEKIDAIAPAPLKSFDAFPKLPSTYRARSSERGFLTLFIAFIAFLLVANDIGEFLWGWPDFEFGVDHVPTSYMDVNVDLIVNMPCKCTEATLLFSSGRSTDCSPLVLSVDLRDTVGDRLYLSKGFHRDGVSAVLTCCVLT